MSSSAYRTLSRSLAALLRPSRSLRPLNLTTPFLRRYATRTTEQPRLRLGSIAPNFEAKTTHGDIDFHNFIANSWAILFSHPADFTPVCTTELGAFAKLKDEYAK